MFKGCSHSHLKLSGILGLFEEGLSDKIYIKINNIFVEKKLNA